MSRKEVTADTSPQRSGIRSQTLERGLDVLQAVIKADQPMSLNDLAAVLSLNRSVVYRLVRSLEDRGLVAQVDGQGYTVGTGIYRLLPPQRFTLLEDARPRLQALAETVRATVVMSIRDRDNEVCVMCVQPEKGGPYLSFREGTAGRLGRGAASLALLALDETRPDERPEVTAARAMSPLPVVSTSGELRDGVTGIAAAYHGSDGAVSVDVAVSVVFFTDSHDEAEATQALLAAAVELSQSAP